MRALVLGGTRFIGKALVKRLAGEGHQVVVLSRRPAEAGVVRIGADRRDEQALRRAASGPLDVVYDFLGMDAADAEVALQALEGRCQRLVHLSTGSVYWVAEGCRCPWIEEEGTSTPLRDRAECDKEEFDYGVAKREAEHVYRDAALGRGFPAVLVRAPVVSGPEDWRRRDLYWLRRILAGRPLVMPDGGLNVFNHVYVEDLVDLLARLATAKIDPGEAFNAADRVFSTLRQYVGWLAEVAGKPARLVDVPRPRLATAGLPDRSFYFADTRNHVLDNRKAESRLGASFRGPERWMPPTVAWCATEVERDPAGESERLAQEEAMLR